jgi:hypothetical protein
MCMMEYVFLKGFAAAVLPCREFSRFVFYVPCDLLISLTEIITITSKPTRFLFVFHTIDNYWYYNKR